MDYGCSFIILFFYSDACQGDVTNSTEYGHKGHEGARRAQRTIKERATRCTVGGTLVEPNELWIMNEQHP